MSSKFINPISIHERLMLLTDFENNNISLDPSKTTSYLLVANSSFSINILQNISSSLPIFLQLYLIIYSLNSINMSLANNINSQPGNNTISLQQFYETHFTFFSYDNGVHWYLVFSGQFGPYPNLSVTDQIITRDNCQYRYFKLYNAINNDIYFMSNNIIQE